jgi:hypothetical protein
MTQQATALIKFKHCDFGEHYADAQAAYDSDPKTAWIAPFTIAQRAYWAQQDGGLINGYAEDYAANRSSSINNSAQSAYAMCLAGGASSSPAPVVEPGFTLVVQAKLDGGSSSGAAASVSTGSSTQLSVPFKPEPAQDQALDWKAFYRVGVIQMAYNYAENWVMSYPAGGGYPLPAYTELLMRPTVKVAANNLVSLSADLVQYMDAPAGKTLTTPESLIADFTAVQSSFSFTIQRRVELPDGQVIQEEFEYETGATSGELSDINATVNFPALDASCDVSGTVDVYHFITAYSFGTQYKLSNKIQQVRVEGVDYDFTVPANAVGSVPPSYGPPGFNSIHESFYYSAPLDFSAFGIAILYVTYNGVIYARGVYLVWQGQPIPSASLQGYTSDMPLPIINAYTPVTPLPTTFTVTFSKDGSAPATVELDIVETAYIEAMPDVPVIAWEAESTPWGSQVFTDSNGARLAWLEAFKAPVDISYYTAAEQAIVLAYNFDGNNGFSDGMFNEHMDGWVTRNSKWTAGHPWPGGTWGTRPGGLYGGEGGLYDIYDTIYAPLLSAYIAKGNAIWASWTTLLMPNGISNYGALATLTNPSTHIYVLESSVRGDKVIRHSIVAPRAMTDSDLKGTFAYNGPWGFGDTLPDFC